MQNSELKGMFSTLTDKRLKEVKSIIDEILMDRHLVKEPVELDILDKSVLELRTVFNQHTWKYALGRANIKTIRELVNMSYDQMLRLKYIGPKKIEQLQRELKEKYQIVVWDD